VVNQADVDQMALVHFGWFSGGHQK